MPSKTSLADRFKKLKEDKKTNTIQKKSFKKKEQPQHTNNSNNTNNKIDIIDLKKKFLDLQTQSKNLDISLKEFCVLYFVYFNRPFNIDSKNKKETLCDIFQLKYPTACQILANLKKKNYILSSMRIINKNERGTTCFMNQEKCFNLFKKESDIDETIWEKDYERQNFWKD